MPIYFFDIEDGQGMHRDDTGLELPDIQSAVYEARRTLADMSREFLSRGADSDHSLKIMIRDHGDGPVRISVAITTDRPEDPTG